MKNKIQIDKEIPEGWDLLPFGEMAELVKDGYKPTGSDDLAYIGLEHINQQSLSLNSIGHSTEVGSNKFFFREGDILFGKLRPYFRKVYRPRFDGVCSTDIWVVRAKEDIDQGFLFYLMANQDFVDLASSGSSGTRMPRADWDYLKDLLQLKPDYDEQRLIARILSDLDEKIEMNHKMIITLESIAQALFKRWFVDFDFPDDRGRPYKSSGGKMVESDFGESPEGWDVRPLDGIAEFLNGLALQKFPPKGDEYLPVIKIRELNQGITESTDKAAVDINEAYVVNDGDVLFSWSGSLQVCIWCEGAGALNQHLFKVSSDEYPKWFYYQWVKFHLPEFQQIAQGKATTMGHIQRHHLSAALVAVPTENILKRMNCVMVPLLEQIITNGIQVRKLSAIRDSLLPKLISGEIRTINK